MSESIDFERARVACVGGALRQFGEFLVCEPEMAAIDAHADLFVGLAELCYSERFCKRLCGDEATPESESVAEKIRQVCNFFEAVAEFSAELGAPEAAKPRKGGR